MRNLIFVDTESTGLADDESAEIVELTWAGREGDTSTLWFGVTEVPDFIDNLISFTKRGIAGRTSPWQDVQAFLDASDNQTLVAANPAHDMHFIKSAGLWRLHYRMLDIETYAMAKLGLSYMPSMKNISDILVLDTEPDHTSRNDVLAMREAFLRLEAM